MKAPTKRKHVLILEDKVGFSDGYKGLWKSLCEKNGLGDGAVRISYRSAYRTFSSREILEWKAPRKQPGFCTKPHVQKALVGWVEGVIAQHQPDAIICMDPALLFLLNPDWQQATIEKLRGGVYILFGIPWLVSFPVTAYYSKAKPKDIAKLNDGFIEKGDFEEYQQELEREFDSVDDEDETEESDRLATFERDSDDDKHVTRMMMQWHEPVVVPYGKIVLGFDLAKMGRLLGRMTHDN